MSGKAGAEGVSVEQPAQYLDEYPAEQAMAMMKAYLTQQRDLSQSRGGRWILPPTHRHMEQGWVFIRLGSRTDQRRLHITELRRAQLKEQGWMDAPRGTRNSLFMQEGEHGVYLCIPTPAWEAREEWERDVRRKLSERRLGKAGADLQALAQTPGLSIESVDMQRGTSTVAEFIKSTSSPTRRK